jgi:hypothetical protein
MAAMIEDPFDRLNRMEDGIVKLSFIMEYLKDQISHQASIIENHENSLKTQNRIIDIQNLRIRQLEKDYKHGETTSSTTKKRR